MIWIFDEKLRKIKQLRQFEMAQWSNKFRDIGTFTINARYVQENLYLLDSTKTYYVLLHTGDDKEKTEEQNMKNSIFGKIEKASKEDEEDADFPSTIKIEGRLIPLLFTKRVINGTVNFTNQELLQYMKNLIDKCFSGNDNKERYVNMDVETYSEETLYNPIYITKQITGGQLWDEFKDYLDQYKIGIRVSPRVVKTFNLSDTSYFDVIAGLSNIEGFDVLITTGKDRRKRVGEGSVIFSKSLSNIKRTSYNYDCENDMNVAYIAGEGEQEERKWYEIQKDEENKKVSWNREELWIDARDIQSEQEDETVLTEEEYAELIKQRAIEKFEENTISDEYVSTLNEYSKKYVYMKDYDLGDWVTVIDHDLDVELDAQIVEVTTTLQNNEMINDLTFEYGKVKRTEPKGLKKLQSSVQNIENNFKYADLNLKKNGGRLSKVENDINELYKRTGDTDWLVPSFTSNVIETVLTGTQVRYRKKNGIVYVIGTVGITGKVSGKNLNLFYLPDGFRPAFSQYSVNTATGYRMSRYYIGSSGTVTLEWVRNLSDGSEVTGGISWIGINFSFPVDE